MCPAQRRAVQCGGAAPQATGCGVSPQLSPPCAVERNACRSGRCDCASIVFCSRLLQALDPVLPAAPTLCSTILRHRYQPQPGRSAELGSGFVCVFVAPFGSAVNCL